MKGLAATVHVVEAGSTGHTGAAAPPARRRVPRSRPSAYDRFAPSRNEVRRSRPPSVDACRIQSQ